MYRIAAIAHLMLGLSVIVANIAFGQSINTVQVTETPGTDVNDAIQDVIVTAQRRSERVQDVPLTVSVQSGEMLARAGISSTIDLPKVFSGLTYSTYGAWAQPNIRGISTTVNGPGADNPVAIYLDGAYLGNQVGGFFDLPDVDQVTVLKGPQGTLFGRNATGGAIQILTLNPSFTPRGSVTLTGGYYDGAKTSREAEEYSVKGYLAGPLTEELAGSLSFFTSHLNGYLSNDVDGSRYGAVSSDLVRGKLLWEPSSAISILASAYYSRRRDQVTQTIRPDSGITAAAEYPGAIYATEPWHVAFDTPSKLSVESVGASVKADIALPHGKLSSQTNYYRTDNEIRVDVDGAQSASCLAAFGCIAFWVKVPDKSVEQEFLYVSDKMGRLSFVAGINAYASEGSEPQRVNDPSKFPNVPGLAGPIFLADALVKTQAYAAFAELNFDLTAHLIGILGERLSHERKVGYGAYTCCDTDLLPQFVDVSWNSSTPRASLRYEFNRSANVYFTYSKGFKSGTVPYSTFTESSAGPESVDAYEIGYKFSGKRATASIAAYYYDYRDLQVVSFSGVSSITNNAATAKIYGADVDAEVELGPGVSLRAAVSYLPNAEFTKYQNAVVYAAPLTPFGLTQYTQDISGSRLFRTPEFTASITGEFSRSLSFGIFSASSTLYHSSGYRFDAASLMVQRAYTTLSADVSLKPAGSRMTYSVWGKNLSSAAYISTQLQAATATGIQNGPPREIGISANYSF